jgi:CPA2 family monovalent cation:H+ antiporter-2
MVVIGKKLLPKLLVVIAKTKSNELMILGVIAISSGFAFIAYTLFGASFALGAFMVVLLAFVLVVFGKAIVAYFIMRKFHQSLYESLIMAVSLAQIGEFSFILAGLALKMNIFSNIVYDMVIASAIISITINPFLFKLVKRIS